MKLIKLPAVIGRTADSRTGHYAKIKAGVMTRPVKLSEHAVAWPEHEINAIIAARVAGKTDDEIRELVSQLMDERTQQQGQAKQGGAQ